VKNYCEIIKNFIPVFTSTMKKPKTRNQIIEENKEGNLEILIQEIIEHLYCLFPNDFLEYIGYQLKVFCFNFVHFS